MGVVPPLLLLVLLVSGDLATKWFDRQSVHVRLIAHRARAVPADAAAATIGLQSSDDTTTLAVTDLYGDLQINSVYQTENDIPEQYAALQEIYTALGGDYWYPAYKQLTYAEEVAALANASSTTSQYSVSRPETAEMCCA